MNESDGERDERVSAISIYREIHRHEKEMFESIEDSRRELKGDMAGFKEDLKTMMQAMHAENRASVNHIAQSLTVASSDLKAHMTKDELHEAKDDKRFERFMKVEISIATMIGLAGFIGAMYAAFIK